MVVSARVHQDFKDYPLLSEIVGISFLCSVGIYLCPNDNLREIFSTDLYLRTN